MRGNIKNSRLMSSRLGRVSLPSSLADRDGVARNRDAVVAYRDQP
jgi:hypothetical protein